MRHDSLRIVFFGIVLACAVIDIRGTALADCGVHEYLTVAAPKLLAAEAIPKISANILSSPGSATKPKRDEAVMLLLLGPDAVFNSVANCPDDPPETASSPRMLANLWSNGIYAGNNAAHIALMKSGKTTEPPACIRFDTASERLAAAKEWAVWVVGYETLPGQNMPSAMIADEVKTSVAMAKLPYYAHVRKLWEDVARELSITLPAPATNMGPWERTLQKAADVEQAHLPNGITCRGSDYVTAR
jgi:hypothetical protein